MAKTLLLSIKKSSLIPKVIIGMGVFLVLGSITAVIWINAANSVAGDIPAAPRAGQRLPDFALEDLDGKPVRLSDYGGQVVLVNFWATWCPPCAKEMPGLEDFYSKHRGKGFTVLAVNVGETKSEAAAFTEQYGLEFPILLDPTYELADGLMIDGYPTSVLVGRDGYIKKVHIGYLSPEDLDHEVYPLLE